MFSQMFLKDGDESHGKIHEKNHQRNKSKINYE